jgi:hypothetical protein
MRLAIDSQVNRRNVPIMNRCCKSFFGFALILSFCDQTNLMRYHFIFTIFSLLIFSAADAQNSEEAAIRNVVVQLFQGMEKGDSAMVHNAFTKEVTAATIFRDKTGNAVLDRETSMDGFYKAIGTPHKDVWYEEFWNLKIQVDGDFAQVWCDYAFYIGDKFSHCGVDALHLHKTIDGWKIFHLADTRRTTGCKIPKDIQKKHAVKK